MPIRLPFSLPLPFFEIEPIAGEGKQGTYQAHYKRDNLGHHAAPRTHMERMKNFDDGCTAGKQVQSERGSGHGQQHKPQHRPKAQAHMKVEEQTPDASAPLHAKAFAPLL